MQLSLGHLFSSRIFNLFFLCLGLVVSSGCSSTYYIWQAAKGQLAISNRARPISEVLESERTPPRVKALLKEVSHVKKFGEKYGIKPTSNYEEYVKWDDTAVSWVVSASDRLKFNPKVWSFPIAGSFNYLGWFSKEDASELADELKSQGLDVYLRGASAFSTLGWFRDPVLSTMLSRGEHAMGRLVNVIIHESVHATLYIPNQSYFNESLASFVADRLTAEYLEDRFGKESTFLKTYQKDLVRGAQNRKTLHEAYLNLDKVYKSKKSEEDKLKEKERITTKLQKKLGFKTKINNAFLIQYKTYGTGHLDFEKLFEGCQRDWNRFWKALYQLSSEAFQQDQLEDFSKILHHVRSQTCNS